MSDYEKPDFYSRKAKSEGYLARSIYKLEEIDQKFKLFKKNMKIVDLGCAPGSWSQYISKKVGENGLVIGIDYKKILVSLPNVILVHGNFLREEKKEEIIKYSPFNGIVSDMAPDTTGDRLTDCYKSSELVYDALKFAYKYLKIGGFFVAKIFQGGDEKNIINEMKEAFEIVKTFKPTSSRKISFETFIIGQNFIKEPNITQLKNSQEEINSNYDLESLDMPW